MDIGLGLLDGEHKSGRRGASCSRAAFGRVLRCRSSLKLGRSPERPRFRRCVAGRFRRETSVLLLEQIEPAAGDVHPELAVVVANCIRRALLSVVNMGSVVHAVIGPDTRKQWVETMRKRPRTEWSAYKGPARGGRAGPLEARTSGRGMLASPIKRRMRSDVPYPSSSSLGLIGSGRC